jgi:phenylacetate-CoA ligase
MQPTCDTPEAAARRRAFYGADRASLVDHQLQRLNLLLREVLSHDGFYRAKYGARRLQIDSLDSLAQLPLLTKEELIEERGGPARFHTYPLERYVRMHRTSGTQGRPLPVLDTADDWCWWLATWQYVLDAAQVTAADTAMMAFSFGPFIGFWSAHDALAARGALVVPAGGMSSEGRLGLIRDVGATIVCCTPTYGLHLAEVAAAQGIDLAASSVRALIVAGEPGGSVPETRAALQAAWGARVIDHSGATELGPWGVGSTDGRGLHVIEAEFIAELLRPGQQLAAAPGELAELVLTGLGRFGAPAIRYRTGDLVRASWDHDRECRFLWLDGGVLGRADDMLVIRGVNVFPSSIEAIVRSLPRLGEFRMIATRRGRLDELAIEVEDPQDDAEEVADLLCQRLGLRVAVATVPVGSLPRFEAKARRLDDRRER